MQIIQLKQGEKIELPLFMSSVSAGFPSPATDFIDKKLDLNQLLIKHPESTFFVRVEGDSMVNERINSGDILIVDRALTAKSSDIVLAVVDGEFTVKKYIQKPNQIILRPANENYSDLIITEDMDFTVWGVVTNVIRQMV